MLTGVETIGSLFLGRIIVGRFIRHLVAAAIALGLATFVIPAFAQMPQVQLTSATVEAFIASYRDVKATADKLKQQYGDPASGGDAMSGWTTWMAVGGAQGALDQAVQSHGFDNFQSWIQVLTSVGMAYGFAKDGGHVDAGMAAALKQIQDNPDLTDDQKKMMMQQMTASMGAVAAIKPPQGNIDAVTPYVDQLTAVFK
jgi:uncharacterized protein YneF (UPF0154 family)